MAHFMPLFFFIALNSSNCVLFRKKFGQILPVTLILTTFIMYGSQIIFRTFSIGYYSMILWALCSPLMFFFVNGFKKNKELVLTNGLIVFVIIYFIYYFIDFHRHLSTWDELMTWGKMVKEMLRLDKFYAVSESTLMVHKDYPPFTSLFELLWCKLLGQYSEMGISMALHVFSLSLLTPYLFDEVIRKEKIAKMCTFNFIICVFYMILISFLDSYGTFNTIYTDIFVALMFAYSMNLVYSREIFNKFGRMSFILSLMALVSIKQIGIAFALLSIFYFILLGLINYCKLHKTPFFLLQVCEVAVYPVLTYLYWSQYTKTLGIVGQFDISTKINLNVFIDSLRVLGTGLQHDTAYRFIYAVFQKNITTSVIPITFVSSVVLVFLLLEIIKKSGDKKNSNIDCKILEVVLTCGALGYAFAMLILYVFCFEKSEMINLGSFPRYMSSYLTGELLVVLFVALSIHKETIANISLNTLMLIIMTITLLSPANMLKGMPQIIKGEPKSEFRRLSNILTEKTEPGKSVFVISTSLAECYAYISYYTNDLYIDNAWVDLLNTDYSQKPDKINIAIDAIKKNDYVYVVQTTDELNKYFSKYNSGNDFKSETVYRIHDNDELVLTPVE